MTAPLSTVTDLRWLNFYENYLFLIDNEIISLYEISEKSDLSFKNDLVYSSSLFTASVRQDHVITFILI